MFHRPASTVTVCLFALMSLLAPFCAEARRDQRREVRQQTRIGQGVRSGELTRKEAAGLRAGQRHIDRTQRRALGDDGMIDAQEGRRLERMQDRQSKAIYNQKHDQQKRPVDAQPVAQPPSSSAPTDAGAQE